MGRWETGRATGDTGKARALAAMAAEEMQADADPVFAEERRRKTRICNCKNVDLGTIEDAVAAHGLTTVEDVRAHTSASGGCSACTVRIETLLEDLGVLPVPATCLVEAAE